MTASAGYAGAAALLAESIDDLVVTGARDVHGSIAGRVHAVTDRIGGRLEHRAHDAIAKVVYGSIGLGLRGAATALRAVDRTGLGPGLEESAAGRFVVSAVNGLIGDELRELQSSMSFEAAFRVGGDDVRLTPGGVARAYPDAGDSLVVFVHGLCENEAYWSRRSRPLRDDGTSTPAYGRRLADDFGWTPVYVRYNSGLPVAENGVSLNSLMTRLVDNWPVEVRRIALVGHSMGGLVVRAACAVDTDPGRVAWDELVTDIVCLGTPHLGAPLERVVARGVPWLSRLPETAPVARTLERRSQGILDLHDGLAPAPAPARARRTPQPRYHLVSASLTRSARHPVALAVGDLLVQPRSALGTPRRATAYFAGANTVHVPKADHFDLLNHDDVYDALAGWLRR